jgi:hypothetical protein
MLQNKQIEESKIHLTILNIFYFLNICEEYLNVTIFKHIMKRRVYTEVHAEVYKDERMERYFVLKKN